MFLNNSVSNPNSILLIFVKMYNKTKTLETVNQKLIFDFMTKLYLIKPKIDRIKKTPIAKVKNSFVMIEPC